MGNLRKSATNPKGISGESPGNPNGIPEESQVNPKGILGEPPGNPRGYPGNPRVNPGES